MNKSTDCANTYLPTRLSHAAQPQMADAAPPPMDAALFARAGLLNSQPGWIDQPPVAQ